MQVSRELQQGFSSVLMLIFSCALASFFLVFISLEVFASNFGEAQTQNWRLLVALLLLLLLLHMQNLGW